MEELLKNWKRLINKEYEFDKMTKMMVLMLIFLISGIFGYIFEIIFYRIDLGYFVNRGVTFGPWIPIYAFGGISIAVFTKKFSKNPFLVFIIICLVTGIIEFTTGYLLFNLWGIRLWDYNTEIWNFGNIGGYICLRSILSFGISGLFLVYCLIPLLNKLANQISKNRLFLISFIPTTIFVIDIILSNILLIIKNKTN